MSYPESCNYNPIGQLIENKAEQIQYFYNASGLVTEVWYEGSPKVKFMYNDRNHRVKKESYHNENLLNSTYYVRDVAGQVMAIYTEDGSQPQLVEQPIYGAGRIGVQYTNGLAVYELTDHLGNVRALFTKESATDSKLEGYTDYYPGGMAMPNRNIVGDYRYNYQGQELDQETGKVAFELRLYDPRINRWLTTDPAGQYHSPYMSMGNNWINRTDPDGGEDNPVYGSDGEYRGDTVEGFTGQPIIYDGDLDFSEMTAGDLVDFNGGTYYDNASLSNSIMHKIESHIFSRLEGQKIFDETFTMSSFEFRVRTGTANEGNGAYSWSRGTKYINRDKGYSNGRTTVENLLSAVIDHEWYSHLMKKQGSFFGSHRLAYQNQVKSPRWAGTTGEFKRYIVNALHKFHGMESDGLLRGIYLKEYLKWHNYSAPIMLDEVIIGGN